MTNSGTNGQPVALVAARTSSTRLPAKALMKFGGRTLLNHVVDAVSASTGISGIVVVTSRHPSDDEIVRLCHTLQVEVWRGDLDDVANRMLSAAAHFRASTFVRISGDSPMIDPDVISFAVKKFASTEVDLVSNVNPRTFPVGQSVEVIRAQVLERLLLTENSSPHDREHVTPILYRHADKISLRSFTPSDLMSECTGPERSYGSMCIDTPEDAECFRQVIAKEGNPDIWTLGWQQCGARMLTARNEMRARAG